MNPRAVKALGALFSLVFGTTLACAAASGDAAGPRDVQPITVDPMAADAGCPHGALEDPHHGFIRCLNPGETSPFADGGTDSGSPDAAPSASPTAAPTLTPTASPTAAPTAAPSANPTAAPSAAPTAAPGTTATAVAPPAGVPATVEMKTPTFESGTVPTAEKALSKLTDAVTKCVNDNGGLKDKTGSLKVEILVRFAGKAEGVEVTGKGISPDAQKCVQKLIRGKKLGQPSSDPVGVTVTYSLKAAK